MARAWHLIARPNGLPKAADFALRERPVEPLARDMVRVTNRFLSVDPYMRGRMNAEKSYVPPFELDEPLTGGAVGEVMESTAEGFAPGDRVLHMLGWRDEAVGPAAAFTKLPGDGAPLQSYLGLLGITGMTAWIGLHLIAEAKAGETLFVSAAAGAVGSVVVQLGKALGMTVIGSAGGAEKCELVRSLGADVSIDYKAGGSLVDRLGEAAPDGIDAYFDNVGGEHLDAALAHARQDARFAECGMIESYNSDAAVPMRHLMQIVKQRVRIRGFILSDWFDRLGDFHREVGPLVASGQVRGVETVRNGLESMPATFNELFSGGNVGKMVVKL